ncbi:o-succinylbenzoate synthase [Pseudalkalibacillus hwajinpoensis]|uniref:o-succinylbenzoate synthase n=1 Tax=Guptibacillus hwajinpoensis TaxID=208199 RepID=UPI001CD3B3BE|nr:o-succinylbenzoate synthase [Pseudalkalibacillus hwajinpoensis]MCA0992039.1 o-succinylbenzoate synthase [Pseudalkalibacillus hwajinpoensis]
MIIESVTLHHIKMNLKTPFGNSLETVSDRDLIIVEVNDAEGNSGLGEGVAFTTPWYTEETLQTSWHMLRDIMIPLVKKRLIAHPSEVNGMLSGIRRNPMAKYAIEGAIWDLYAKKEGISLSKALGGTLKKIKAGVAVGAADQETMLEEISNRILEGYERIKVKIKPSQDVSILKAIRERYPNLSLMADANSAYTLRDIDQLKALDDFNLLMIEQPLAADDIVDHAKLQRELKTPICLDESIASFDDARRALDLNSCQVINIKPGRVGGLTASKMIHDLCDERGVPVWCGGMLESGIGRAHNIALSSLSNFVFPGDISASTRYWERDIIQPEVIVEEGYITVPEGNGIGYELNRKELSRVTVVKEVY